MKNLNYKIVLYTLLITPIFVGCKDNIDPGPSDHDVMVNLLAKTWIVKNNANAITLDGNDEIVNWPGFSVTFTESKTYTATNISPERLGTVWSTSGSWEFKSTTDLNTIVRDDGVEINLVVDDNNLTMSFMYSSPGGRIRAVDGSWMFSMQ